MGALQDFLASLDNKRRVLARNASDWRNDPAGALQQLRDHWENGNRAIDDNIGY